MVDGPAGLAVKVFPASPSPLLRGGAGAGIGAAASAVAARDRAMSPLALEGTSGAASLAPRMGLRGADARSSASPLASPVPSGGAAAAAATHGYTSPVPSSPVPMAALSIMGPPPTPMHSAPVFMSGPAGAIAAASVGASAGPNGPPPPLPPRLLHRHTASSVVPVSAPVATAVSVAPPPRASASPPPYPTVFSHAPAHSSISIRNGKKAAFYAAYLRRGELDEDFLASSFELARLAPANDAIVIEIEDDPRSREAFQAYLDLPQQLGS
jgi:hypothetical protein